MSTTDNWTYVLTADGTDSGGTDHVLQAIQTKVQVGQIITVAWDCNGYLPTNRYIWRCVGAIFDGYGGYAALTQASGGNKGQATYTVNTAGNILFGGYSAELNTASFHGKWIKVKIENPA